MSEMERERELVSGFGRVADVRHCMYYTTYFIRSATKKALLPF